MAEVPRLEESVLDVRIRYQREKLGTLGRVPRDIYQHISPIYGLHNGCIGQYGVMFWEQLLGYPPKGTQIFPLKIGED